MKLITQIILIAGLFGLFSFHSNEISKTSVSQLHNDTIVGSKTITNEIAGSSYRHRTKGYFIVDNSDTSELICILSEEKFSKKVGINLNVLPDLGRSNMTYKNRMAALKKVLPLALTEFKFEPYSFVDLGNFLSYGDLAVDVTKEYRKEFGSNSQFQGYDITTAFLLKTKIATDFNELFKPYSFTVDKVDIEKFHFADRRSLYFMSKLETDTNLIPKKVLCFSIGLLMK